jgi:glycosyltransferase involved in cell wall biosynthesis
MIQDQDIVCISSIDWDFIWQGHQQIMSMLAEGGNRVLFVEHTGVRRPRLDDLSRVRHRFYRWWTSTRGFRQQAPNLHVFSPLILPWPYSRVARRINRALLSWAIRRWMRIMKFKKPIVWTFLPTPLAREVLWALAPEVSIYYCVDDLASSSPQVRRIRQTEETLFSEVDLVFVTSQRLRTLALRFSDRVHVFPFAVDYPPFEAARTDGSPPPSALAALPGPVAGYLGGIHRWIDQALLVETAQRLPDVTFALVGPLQTEVGRLARCANVRFLGSCSHAEVPRYLKAFDVALIPYRLTEYTASVYPTKMNEYLAMGLPVVATALPEIARFNAEYGNIITVGGTTDDFVAGVRAALETSRPGEIARRIAVAQSNSWEARVAAMSRLIEARLEPLRRLEESG